MWLSQSAPVDLKLRAGGSIWAHFAGTALWVLKGEVLFLLEVHAPLAGSFKTMDEMNAAQEKQNLSLARTAAGIIAGRLE